MAAELNPELLESEGRKFLITGGEPPLCPCSNQAVEAGFHGFRAAPRLRTYAVCN